jgi:hypothetical protein
LLDVLAAGFSSKRVLQVHVSLESICLYPALNALSARRNGRPQDGGKEWGVWSWEGREAMTAGIERPPVVVLGAVRRPAPSAARRNGRPQHGGCWGGAAFAMPFA